jgi:hypothetical protein
MLPSSSRGTDHDRNRFGLSSYAVGLWWAAYFLALAFLLLAVVFRL